MVRLEPQFYIRQGDRLPYFEAQLTDTSGAPVDLTGKTVWFNMTPGIRNEMSIVDEAQGVVRYLWREGDTDLVGTHGATIQVEEEGVIQTWPSMKQIVIYVLPKVIPGV